MTEDDLKAYISKEIQSAIGHIGGQVSADRREALEYYYSEPLGNEVEGRSKIVSSDVQDTIESLMPDFMEIFAGGDSVCEVQPFGPEDEENAQQATDYINYIWTADNNGFEITHDVVKDGLLQKNGFAKAYWDDSEETSKETLENLNTLALSELSEDKEVEIVAATQKQAEGDFSQYAPDGVLYDVEIKRTRKTGRVKVLAIPPEEFLISRQATSLDEAVPFVGHRSRKTVSELIKMGFDRELLDDLPSEEDQSYSDEAVARYEMDDEWQENQDANADPSMKRVWLYECYPLVDFDGDGIAERRLIHYVGNGKRILTNEEIEEHPFTTFTPIRMGHKFFGRSIHDLVKDVQTIKTTIQRQLLDNMYLVNNGRSAISSKVNLDDWLTNRPGGAVRVDDDGGNVSGHIMPIQTQSLGPYAYPLLEYWDGVRETRTGVTRYSQGTDASSLNKTATGISQILGRTQRRTMLIARTFAEVGFKPLFGKMLRLIIRHQDAPRVIRLRNQWVPIDPRTWNTRMDVSINVGLGYGTKETRVGMLTNILGVAEKIIQYQGGPTGPIIVPKHIYNLFEDLLNASGMKNKERYAADPGDEPPQPQPNPEADKAQIEIQDKQMDLEMKKAEHGMKLKQLQAQSQFDAQRMKMEHDLAVADLRIKAQQLNFKRQELAMKERAALVSAAVRGNSAQVTEGGNNA